MRSIAVLLFAVLTVSPPASCTAPPSMDPGITDWWANQLGGLAGTRPPKPHDLALSSWSTGGITILWRRGPAFLSTPRADRWEVKIARGGWTAAPARDTPGGILVTSLRGPPPEDGTRVSVRGVNGAGPGPASSIRIAIPQLQGSVPSRAELLRGRARTIAAHRARQRARQPPCHRPPPGVPSRSLSRPGSGARDR